jgi:hypothetical protein
MWKRGANPLSSQDGDGQHGEDVVWWALVHIWPEKASKVIAEKTVD